MTDTSLSEYLAKQKSRIKRSRRINNLTIFITLGGLSVGSYYLVQHMPEGVNRDYILNLAAGFYGGLLTFVLIRGFENNNRTLDHVQKMTNLWTWVDTLQQQIKTQTQNIEEVELQINRLTHRIDLSSPNSEELKEVQKKLLVLQSIYYQQTKIQFETILEISKAIEAEWYVVFDKPFGESTLNLKLVTALTGKSIETALNDLENKAKTIEKSINDMNNPNSS